MLEKYRINSREKLNAFIDDVANIWCEKHYIVATLSDKRTLPQNAVKSVFYKEIADHFGDRTPKEVERECKLIYGVPILRRREMENWLYERTLDKLNHVQKLMIMDKFKITSDMSVEELNEYIKEIQADFQFLEVKKKTG